MDEKLAIVVPYRNRKEHLDKFLPAMESCSFLDGIDYEILIVEQEEGKPFNRGKILNIGAVHSKNSAYYCFHDVDMLPISSDYSYVSAPTHLASEAEQFGFKLPYNGYFGGVTLFDKHSFNRINGYSNDYWGWGAEDDDVLYRCAIMEVPTYRKDCKYRSLDHTRNIEHVPYMKNIDKFQNFRKNPTIQAIMADGITTLKYEKIGDKRISDHSRMITVML
jgi:predicted glycosyltransferase involved in capsule biosynthesis